MRLTRLASKDKCRNYDDPIEVALCAPKRSAPRIACFPGEQCQYFIYVESEVLCEVTSFAHALMLWFVSHYVFNLEYCTKAKEVALFFPRVYLQAACHW